MIILLSQIKVQIRPDKRQLKYTRKTMVEIEIIFGVQTDQQRWMRPQSSKGKVLSGRKGKWGQKLGRYQWENIINLIIQNQKSYILQERIMIQDNSQPAVANFVQKSFEIITNEENSAIIEWLPSGKQFIIKNTDLFESVILPHYFRHRNINSFIRQLNMYGFHKSRKEPTKNIFSHPNFLKGKPEILINVRRKLKEDKNDENTPAPIHPKKHKDEPIQEKIIPEQPKQTKNPVLPSRELIRSRQHLDSNLEKREKELEKTAIKHDYLVSLCSMENIEDFGNQQNNKSNDWPFRSLIEKSLIMELNPEMYALKFQNITSLNHIDELQFDFSSGNEEMNRQNSMDEIEKERKRLNNRMAGYNILQTINFMSELNL